MSFPSLIDSQDEFNRLIEALRKDPVVAVDTEFHCEKRYWPDLFLIQLASQNTGPLAVDPLAVRDLSALGELFADGNVVKAVHSARNDLQILFHDIEGFTVRNLFDTQIAASFLGYGEQISLVNLVQTVCGIKAHKKYSMSDWSARPLDEGQLDYALDDVRYLVKVHRRLASQLSKKGRTAWFLGEQESLTDPATYGVSLEKLFAKARSAGKIKKANFPLLWMLIRWREETARNMNRPRYFVGRDHLLCRLAILAPVSLESIERLRGLPGGFTDKYGEDVIQIVEQCRKAPPKDVPRLTMPRHDWGYGARKDILRIFLKMKSESLDLSPSLLLPSHSFESLLEKPPASLREFMDRKDLTEWRKEAIGTELVDLLTGKLAMSLEKGRSLRFVKV